MYPKLVWTNPGLLVVAPSSPPVFFSTNWQHQDVDELQPTTNTIASRDADLSDSGNPPRWAFRVDGTYTIVYKRNMWHLNLSADKHTSLPWTRSAVLTDIDA